MEVRNRTTQRQILTLAPMPFFAFCRRRWSRQVMTDALFPPSLRTLTLG